MTHQFRYLQKLKSIWKIVASFILRISISENFSNTLLFFTIINESFQNDYFSDLRFKYFLLINENKNTTKSAQI